MGWQPDADDGTGQQPGPGPSGGPGHPGTPAAERDPRLAGFGHGGAWDACPPSAALAAALDAMAGPGRRCAGAERDELVGMARQWQAIEAWAAAGKLAVLRALLREDDLQLPGTPRHGDLPDEWSKSLTLQVAAALAMPAPSANKLLSLAGSLACRLPGTGALLAAGKLTCAKAKAVNEAMELLSDEDAAAAEAMIVPQLPGKTYGQVERLATAAAVAVDPESAARRREDAERRRSRVMMFREQSGAAALSGRDLPTDQTLAAHAQVCARAQEYKDSGVFGGTRMDQFRAAAYLDLLNQISAADRIASGHLVTDRDADPADPWACGTGPDGCDCSCAECDGGCLPPEDDDDGPDDEGPRPEDRDHGGDGPSHGPNDVGLRPEDHDHGDDEPGDAPDDEDPRPEDHDLGADGSGDGADDRGLRPEDHVHGSDGPADGPHDGGPRPEDRDHGSDGPADGADDGVPGCEDRGHDDHGPGDGADDDCGALPPEDDDQGADGSGPDEEGPDDEGPGGEAGSDGSPGGAGGAARDDEQLSEPGVVPRLTDLVLPLATLLGISERPGEGHGLGVLDPELCRDLAVRAVASPHSTLCATVTGPDGIAIGHGCARPGRRKTHDRQASSMAALPSRVNLTVTRALLVELAGCGPPGTPSPVGWALTPGAPGPPGDPPWCRPWTLTLPGGTELTVRLEPLPTFDCDHRHESHAYQPSDKLRHLVQIRDHQCTFPPCSRHARESDFEHAIPYHKGGKTCGCNAGARSRQCHQVKQSPGWQVTQPKPGWHRWETPTGRAYTQEPHRYPV